MNVLRAVVGPGRAADAGLAAGFVVMWSSGFVGAELSARVTTMVTVLTWRFLVSTVVLLAVRAARGGPMPGRRAVGVQAAVGLFAQAGYLAGTVGAVQLGVPAGSAALIAALQPLAAGIVAGPALRERVSPRQWVGLAIGLAGVTLVVANDLAAPQGTAPWAYLLPFCGMLSLVAATVLERKTAVPVRLVDGLTVQVAVSAVAFVPVAAATGTLVPPADLGFWLAVAWTVVLSGFGGYGFYWLNARRAGVTRLNVLLYLTPPTTGLWALAMFGEPFGPLAAAGMVVCACSVPLVYWRGRATATTRAAVRETVVPSSTVGGGS